MKKALILLLFIIAIIANISAQGISCGGASPFCTGSSYNFPAGVNAPAAPPSGTAPNGPNYGCLFSQPNCAWYFMQVGTSGNIELYINGSGNFDVDFCCWGPYTSQSQPCLLGLTAGTPTPNHHAAGPSPNYPTLNMVDCSYDPSYFEWCYIPNAVSGQYYILLITNYSNQIQNIVFSQSNAGQAGAGTTNCGILPAPLGNNSPCQGDTLKLTAMTVPNATYYWSGPGGWASTLQNPILTNATVAMSGNYICNIMVGTQISPSDTTVVTVHPKPVVTATSDTICAGASATLTASGANTYKWTPGGSTSNPLVVNPLVTTTYKVVGSTTFGCKDSVNTYVQVYPGPVVTVNNVTICAGETATLTATGANSYSWSNSMITNPITVNPMVTTSYIVTGNSNGCIGTATSTVTVHPRPNISLDSVSICQGKIATMTVIGTALNSTYLWSNNTTFNPLTISPSSSMLVSVVVTDSNTCKDTASAMLTVYPLPIAAFVPVPTTASTDNPLITFTDLSANATSWQWDFGNINSPDNTSILENPTHKYTAPGTFTITLVVQSDHGCVSSTSGKVLIENPYECFIPNAFTPSSTNAETNSFKLKGIGIDPSKFIMIIYDRWGKEIFKTTDINEGWNGKFNNVSDLMPTGTYVYYIRFSQILGDEKEFTGHVTLL